MSLTSASPFARRKVSTPTMRSPEFFALRARVAAMTRQRPADDPELLAARKQLQEMILVHSISQAVTKAAPLSDDVRQRVIGLLSAAA